MDVVQSLTIFVRNVTDFDGLDHHLMEAARSELGASATKDQVAQRESRSPAPPVRYSPGHQQDSSIKTG